MCAQDLFDPVDNPNLISGIHNYCDRWCERCPFTARCAVYAMEEADPDLDPAARDINNAAFWQKLARIFSETHAMIAAMAEERGIDLSDEALGPVQQEKQKQRSSATNHPLAKLAKGYAIAVAKLFDHKDSEVHVVSDDAQDLNQATKAQADVEEYVAVIRWYQIFIGAKLTRALMSRVDEDDYLADEYARDSDGSAKAALIAIDRSMSAWKMMCDLLPEKADDCRNLLLDLEKLRLGAEREFPHARDFIRPGFDEISLDMLH